MSPTAYLLLERVQWSQLDPQYERSARCLAVLLISGVY